MSGNPFGVMISGAFEENDMLQKIKDAMTEIQNFEALIGIPQEANVAHKDENGADSPITLAELLYIHTYGSPVNNIPARDVLDSAMEHNQDDIVVLLKKVLERASNGDLEGAKAALDKAGIQGASMAQKWFTDPANDWTELKDSAIRARQRKMSKGRIAAADKLIAQEKASGNKKALSAAYKPLVDTGGMRDAITSVVRRKGRTKR